VTVPSGAVPAAGPGVTATVATKTRPEGTAQVTYGGAPLYRFAADKAPGDANGQGVGGIWFVVPVSGPAATGATPATTAPPATTAGTASCAYPPCM
jgi:hypothetical protein